MRSKSKKRKPSRWKTKLGLPDLDHAKAAVLASLHSPESQRSYRHAIDEFVGWYCSEPRLSFNKTVVTRYRIHLEDRQLAPGTTNVRLAAVRRPADEAADAGLLSPELAAGIRRVEVRSRDRRLVEVFDQADVGLLEAEGFNDDTAMVGISLESSIGRT
jgi:hypothetical protein